MLMDLLVFSPSEDEKWLLGCCLIGVYGCMPVWAEYLSVIGHCLVTEVSHFRSKNLSDRPNIQIVNILENGPLQF
jgi:hypothetical protein